MADAHPNISIQYLNQAIVIALTERKILDEQEIRTLQQTIQSVYAETDNTNLILDFTQVEFLSSAMLGMLIRLSKRVLEKDGQFKLCGINPRIFEVFKITQLTKVFDIYSDVDDALQGV